ncbi:MAG TPA: hypothetical protein VFH51_06545 [Myxococcota bacterium]|nr:hypothetical protein [Myxococcota bacterium]
MSTRPPLWTLLLLSLGLLGFWAQQAWDQAHPPVYHGPWGDMAPP